MRRTLSYAFHGKFPAVQRFQECSRILTRLFSSEAKDTEVDAPEAKKLGRARTKPSLRRQNSYVVLSKGGRVSFRRMKNGPKRDIALVDSFLRRRKLGALVRTVHKAVENNTVIDPIRCEKIIFLLMENSRMHDMTSLVTLDTFHVTLRALLLIMNPLLLSGRAELVYKLLEKIPGKSLQLYYPEFMTSLEKAKARRKLSNTPLTSSESRGFNNLERILKTVKLQMRMENDDDNDDDGTKTDDWTQRNMTPAKVREKKLEFLMKLAGSRYLDVNNFFVEDRRCPQAPNLEFNDLSKILEKQGEAPLLFNSTCWPIDKHAYSRRNGNIMEELLQAKQRQLDEKEGGNRDFPSIISISIGTPDNPNMASSIWKAGEIDFEDTSSEHYDGLEESNDFYDDENDDGHYDDNFGDEEEDIILKDDVHNEYDVTETIMNDKERLKELFLGKYLAESSFKPLFDDSAWREDDWDFEDDDDDDDIDEVEERAYQMLDPVFRKVESSAAREAAGKAYHFKEMIHYWGGTATRLPPGFTDLTSSIEQWEIANGTYGTDKAVRFTDDWERYKKLLKDPEYTNYTLEGPLASVFSSTAPTVNATADADGVNDVGNDSARTNTVPTTPIVSQVNNAHVPPKSASVAVTTASEVEEESGPCSVPAVPIKSSEWDKDDAN